MVRAVASRVVPRERISKAVAREAAAEAALVEELAANAGVPRSVRNIPTRASANRHTVHAIDNYSNKNTKTTAPNGHGAGIPDLSNAKAALRPMGNGRRLFLLDAHLTADDMEGLSHRIRALSKNEGLTSLLIATDDQDDVELNCLPRYITNRRDVRHMFDGVSMDRQVPQHTSSSSTSSSTNTEKTWYVSGGYDPLKVADVLQGLPTDQDRAEYVDYVLDSLNKLAVAVQGGSGVMAEINSNMNPQQQNPSLTRVPVITVPHGAVTDGGYALCLGSYVLSTPESSFRLLNPSRGLGLDPVGFSYILPRLGWEHQQVSAKYSPGCGLILALAGYEANAFDMVETGLATHLVADNVSGVLPILEEGLAVMEPWNQQGLVKPNKRYYGQDANNNTSSNNNSNSNFNRRGGGSGSNNGDSNALLRNKRIAYLMDQVSDHSADAAMGDFPYDFTAIYEGDDASLDTDHVPWESGFFSSPLVDLAAHLDRSVFRKEKSLEELMELLRQEAGRTENCKAENGEEAIGYMDSINVAQDLVDRMERQSPLALRVVYQLLKTGGRHLSTFEKCMESEARAQQALMLRSDFANWAAHVRKHGGDEQAAPPFGGWQHANVKAVTADEVEEILS